jgi:hypothetical protein
MLEFAANKHDIFQQQDFDFLQGIAHFVIPDD